VTDVFGDMAEEIRKREFFLKLLMRTNEKRKLQNDLKILKRGNDLYITGINATGPVHQGRESIKDSLSKGYCTRILLLDPRSDEFFERAEKEDDRYGRILKEFGATIGGLIDIVDNIDVEPNLTIGLHKNPYCAIVIGTHDNRGEMQINLYPEGRGVRGLRGKTYRLSSRGFTKKLFALGSNYFDALEDSSDKIRVYGVDDLLVFEKELKEIATKKYGF
jgi:hypothetical protein